MERATQEVQHPMRYLVGQVGRVGQVRRRKQLQVVTWKIRQARRRMGGVLGALQIGHPQSSDRCLWRGHPKRCNTPCAILSDKSDGSDKSDSANHSKGYLEDQASSETHGRRREAVQFGHPRSSDRCPRRGQPGGVQCLAWRSPEGSPPP